VAQVNLPFDLAFAAGGEHQARAVCPANAVQDNPAHVRHKLRVNVDVKRLSVFVAFRSRLYVVGGQANIVKRRHKES
jgi:hypothetical protein